jgi:hypothetical protein
MERAVAASTRGLDPPHAILSSDRSCLLTISQLGKYDLNIVDHSDQGSNKKAAANFARLRGGLQAEVFGKPMSDALDELPGLSSPREGVSRRPSVKMTVMFGFFRD